MWRVTQSPSGFEPAGQGPPSTGSASPTPAGTGTFRPFTTMSRWTWSCRTSLPSSGVRPAYSIRLSAYLGSPHGARVVRGFVDGFAGATRAHGSTTRARELPGSSTKVGAASRPVPSVVMNGTRSPPAQYHTWWPLNVMLPVRVSTECEPEEPSSALRPVVAFRNTMRAGPSKSNRSALVPTSLPAFDVTVTTSGN